MIILGNVQSFHVGVVQVTDENISALQRLSKFDASANERLYIELARIGKCKHPETKETWLMGDVRYWRCSYCHESWRITEKQIATRIRQIWLMPRYSTHPGAWEEARRHVIKELLLEAQK